MSFHRLLIKNIKKFFINKVINKNTERYIYTLIKIYTNIKYLFIYQ
ncbi:MAG: hypothetical protein K0S30_284 [Clostridia bacterium]|jgi:hypothetical protein|nr:hypothetical protein [Clostridia bacterium]